MIEDFDRDLFKKCIPYFDKLPVIFDIGAHEGHYTKFVLETITDADCYLFEPNEKLFKNLWKTFQYNEMVRKPPNVFTSPFAISDREGYKIFFNCPKANDELSSLYKRKVFNDTGFEETEVQCTSIDLFSTLFKVQEIDYIKVDVEGAELDVLNGCHSMMRDKKIKFIQIEYGGTYKDAGITFKQIIQTANLFGYRVYELVKNNFTEVTEENFIEDYRYGVFLLTYLPC